MDEFNRKFNSILSQVSDKIQGIERDGSDTNFKEKLQIAINAWGHELTPDWDNIYREWKTTEPPSSNILQESLIRFSNKIPDYVVEPFLIKTIPVVSSISEMLGIVNILNKLNIKNENMEITLLVAFLIASSIYGLSVLNNPRQRERNNKQLNDSHSSQFLTDRDLTPPPDPRREYTQPSLEYSLVLVVYAAQKNLADSIRQKGRIDREDSKILYQATQRLSKNTQSIEDINNGFDRFHVLEVEESEYDIYLITIQLKQDEPRFNKGVNQLDRCDAFCELPDLALSVEVSERLKMEAYADFDVYVR